MKMATATSAVAAIATATHVGMSGGSALSSMAWISFPLRIIVGGCCSFQVVRPHCPSVSFVWSTASKILTTILPSASLAFAGTKVCSLEEALHLVGSVIREVVLMLSVFVALPGQMVVIIVGPLTAQSAVESLTG